MSKRLPHTVIIQNIEVGGTLALSTFLTGLLSHYDYTLRHVSVIVSRSQHRFPDGVGVYETHTNYNKIVDNLRFVWRTFKHLRRIHRQNPIGVLHCFYPSSSLVAAALFKWTTAQRVKILYEVRSPWIEMVFAQRHVGENGLLRKLMHLSEKILVRFADGFVFISEGLRDYYHRRYGLPKVPETVIPSGIALSRFRSAIDPGTVQSLQRKLYIRQDEIIIGYIGTLSHSRRMVEFLESVPWAQLPQSVRFILVGDGDAAADLRDLAKTHAPEHRLVLTGRINHADVPAYLQLFDYGWCHLPDVFVYRHSFPLKVLEYLSAGLPVLASSLEAHRDLHTVFPEHVMLYTDAGEFTSRSFEKSEKRIPEALSAYDYHNFPEHYEAIYQKL